MPILFNKVERGNPLDKSAAKKWYPTLKTISRVAEKDVAKEIADETTLNRKEAEMALDQLEKVLIKNLLASNSVKLGDWGTFHLTCNGTASDTKDGVTANNIKNLNIRFVAGQSLKNALDEASFIAAESVVSKQ
ncbi:MAG: HU family DNA-binding protein [Paludibacter sp.]|jgi:predicted histone-like DNA-binding protein|nr:HU family DNA-binding protein [Paludibacter sp.]